MGEKFMGMGLKKGVSLWVFIILMTVIAKVVLNKYPVKGLTDIVNVV